MSRHQPPQDAIAAIVEGLHGDPFSVLGPRVIDGDIAIRAFVPGAPVLDRKSVV